jgi:hypothetical protein
LRDEIEKPAEWRKDTEQYKRNRDAWVEETTRDAEIRLSVHTYGVVDVARTGRKSKHKQPKRTPYTLRRNCWKLGTRSTCLQNETHRILSTFVTPSLVSVSAVAAWMPPRPRRRKNIVPTSSRDAAMISFLISSGTCIA